MTTVYRTQLGPESTDFDQGRSPHGRWRWGYHRASAPETDTPTPAALAIIHDADRLAFAMTNGPAAAYLADQIADYLWTREALNEEWPVNLREWLDDTEQFTGAPAGTTPTGFICGRLERNLPGGRIYLAWLGMHGIRLLDRSNNDLTLDTAIGEDEGWTLAHGPEPEGLGLHAYRGSLFGLARMIVLSPGADPLRKDLPDMANPEVQHALEDWAAESEHDLALFDLRLNPVLSEPNRVVVNYRWVSPDLCVLFWQPSPNATAYRVQESETPAFDAPTMLAELTDGRQTQYKISPPTSSPRYYRVIPLNQGVPGTPSEPVRPTPLVLTAPVMQPVEWNQDGGYVLQWTPIEQATSYEVQTASAPDFDPHDSEVIYRGEITEIYLAPTTPVNRYYRVRAINVLYAPQTPSPWSKPRRAPARLATPHFTSVTHERMEWEAVPGAQQYAVRVTARGEDPEMGEDVFTRDTSVRAADQSATYMVRALRHADDQRTASEWSDPVTLAPKDAATAQPGSTRALAPLLVAAAVVALFVGTALGIGGIEAYQRANATATRTPYPDDVIAITREAATYAAVNATQVEMLSTRVRETEAAFVYASATAAAWTETPTPTATFTPSNTPNLTETLDAAFVIGATGTASGWTATPTPTVTNTPTITPNVGATIESEFFSRLEATAAAATATPTATNTPDLGATIEVEFLSRLTATATVASATPSPTLTPDFGATAEAAIATRLTATAGAATATLIPDVEATVAAYIENGCYIITTPPDGLPVYRVPASAPTVVLDSVPLLAQVLQQVTLVEPEGTFTWVQVRIVRADETITGWLRLPQGTAPTRIYGGPGCPQE